MRIFASLAFIVCGAALAQGPGSGDLRTPAPPPPVGQPAQSGESPALDPPATPGTAAPAGNRSRQGADRCAELARPMREQCLLEQQGGAAGATSVPQPRTAPPPQNPR